MNNYEIKEICADCGEPADDVYPLVPCGDCGHKLCQIDCRCIENRASTMYGCPKGKYLTEIEWPENYFERREAETPDKGWLDITVRLASGVRYPLHFCDLARAAQSLEDARAEGHSSFSEPGLVLVKKVNTDTVRRVVAERFSNVNYD